MKNNNKLIALQVFIFACIIALPFISIYCQERPTRQLRRIKRLPRKKSPVAPPIAQPEIKNIDESTQEMPKEPTESTPQIEEQPQPEALRPPTTWSWYNTIVPFLLVSAYKGTETGIGALTTNIISSFINRRNILAQREDLEKAKQKLNALEADFLTNYGKYLTEEGKSEFQYLSEKEQQPIKNKIASINLLNSTIEKKESKLIPQEKQTTIPAIMATSAYIGILNTTALIMGTLMGSVFKIALQMLMPAQPS